MQDIKKLKVLGRAKLKAASSQFLPNVGL